METSNRIIISSSDPVIRSQPTREEISQRARQIWMRKGCPQGEDEQNWLEAEQQLLAESVPVERVPPVHSTSTETFERSTVASTGNVVSSSTPVTGGGTLGSSSGDSFDAQETTHHGTDAPLTETAPLSTKVERELKGRGRPAGRGVTSLDL